MLLIGSRSPSKVSAEMIDRLLAKRIVPVVVLDDAKDAEPLAQALLDGGLDIIEVTFRTAAAEESIQRISKAFPEILLGAGTLLDTTQVEKAHAAGASFGLAPGLNPEIIAKAQSVGMEFSPGVMTPGEVEAGLSLGCKLQKFFPAMAAGGPGMLKALAGPYAHTGVKFVPTGGINRSNLRDFLDLPVVAAIGGSWMVDRKLIQVGDWAEITRLTKDALDAAS